MLRVHTLDRSPRSRFYFDDVARPDGGAEDYFSSGDPDAGRWMGSGLRHVGLRVCDEVDSEALGRLIFEGLHPAGGEPLGQRVRDGNGVTAFGMTFSPPKSVSLLWALGGPATETEVLAAHHQAVEAGLGYLERHACYVRRGRDGVEQLDGGGFLAAGYTHRTSRECDPQLHTHVLVANRTMTPDDGRWRTLDSREILGRPEGLKAAGALYQAALRAELIRRLGVAWESVSEHGQADIIGVSEGLLTAFSKRSQQVRAGAERAVSERIAGDPERLGRPPTQRELQLAAYRTRRQKVEVETTTLRQLWTAEAAVLGWDGARLEAATVGRVPEARSPVPDIGPLNAEVLDELTGADATFRRGHVALAVARRTEGRSATEVATHIERLTTAVLASSQVVSLGGSDEAGAGFPHRLSDGRSTATRAGDRRYSLDVVLAQEARIAEAAESGRSAGVGLVPPDTLAWALTAHDAAFPHRRLGTDQAEAVAALVTDGQLLSVLVGPAGTGKSTTLGVARAAWEAAGYRVRGYAPFGAAAQSLGETADMEAEVVAKLLFEQRRLDRLRPEERERWTLTPQDVVVVDEAATLTTADLDALVRAVDGAGAKLVLAGDHRQLASVGRGGMFAELHRRLGGPELSEVHRLRESWEREAATALRRQDPRTIDAYMGHDRVRAGARDAMVEAAYAFWAENHLGGLDTLVVARTNQTATEINARARQLLVELAHVAPGGAAIAGGSLASAGDVVVTRHPGRNLVVCGTGGYVRNGVRWRVLSTTTEGDLVAEELRPARGRAPGRVRLPADYAAEHVRLGYATTYHSAQGVTVDRVGVVVDGAEDANGLYSAATRARDGATFFVATEATETAAEWGKQPPTVTDVLSAVIRRDGEKVAAIAALAQELGRSERLARLEILATAGQPTGELATKRRELDLAVILVPGESDIVTARSTAGAADATLADARRHAAGARRYLDELEARPRWRRDRHELSLARHSVAATEARLGRAEQSLADARRRVDDVTARVEDHRPQREQLARIEAALELQVDHAVAHPADYLEQALGPRPSHGSAQDRWDGGARALEAYRHTELGLSPDDGPLGPTGVQAAIGPCPDDYVSGREWEWAADPPELRPELGLDVEPLGIEL